MFKDAIIVLLLKEARWIGKNSTDEWLEKIIDHKTPTGQTRKIKVKSLPWEERIKYAPKELQQQLQEQGKPGRGRPKKEELKEKIEEKKKEIQPSVETGHVIPDKLKKNYEIQGNIRNVKNWKAKIILNNSAGEGDEKGKMDDVGYIMVSLNSNNIVPIARADEHRTGYELLHHLKQKGLVPKEDFVSVYSVGNNYVYGDEDRDEKIKGYKKFVELGGNGNLMVYDNGTNTVSRMNDYVKGEGKITVPKDELAPVGKETIGSVEGLAKQYKKILDKPNDYETKRFFDDTNDFIRSFDTVPYHNMGIDFDDWKKFKETVVKAEGDNDYATLADSLFGMNGIKNKMHQKIRQWKKDPSDIDARDLKQIYGDPETAMREFNRLGEI